MGKVVTQLERDLYAACATGESKRARELLAEGADVTYVESRYAYTAIHAAAEGGHTECIAVCLDAEPEIDARDEHGQTALMLAKEADDEEVVEAIQAALHKGHAGAKDEV